MSDGIPHVGIFETYVFPEAYGNLRYIEAVFRKLSDEDVDRFVFISPLPASFAAPASPVARRTVSVPTPDSLLRFGGGTFRPRYAWRLPGALMRYTAPLTRVLRRERVEIVQCHNVRSLLTIAW